MRLVKLRVPLVHRKREPFTAWIFEVEVGVVVHENEREQKKVDGVKSQVSVSEVSENLLSVCPNCASLVSLSFLELPCCFVLIVHNIRIPFIKKF